MYTLNTWLVWSWHGWLSKSISIRDMTFHTSFGHILVVRKWKIKSIDIWAFGDGMELIHISTSPFMTLQISHELLVQALQIYTEYDETYDAHIAYAYHFPKDEDLIKEVNQLLPSWTMLKQENKFVKVVSDQDPKSAEWLTVLLKHNGKRGVISYLYGLSLIYGTWIGEWWGMEIRFPFSGSVVSYESSFERIKNWLLVQWYDIERKIIDADVWQSVCIYIHDRCILEQFALWQWVQWPLPGRERAQRYTAKLLEFLKMEHTPWDTMKNINNWLLKLRKK